MESEFQRDITNHFSKPPVARVAIERWRPRHTFDQIWNPERRAYSPDSCRFLELPREPIRRECDQPGSPQEEEGGDETADAHFGGAAKPGRIEMFLGRTVDRAN